MSFSYYLLASSIATATATVIPTMGLLPFPIREIFLFLIVTHYNLQTQIKWAIVAHLPDYSVHPFIYCNFE